MTERRISRPKEVIQKVKEKSIRDKAFLAVEAALLVYLCLYIASTIEFAATGRLEETKESALDTLRMTVFTTAIYGIDKFTKNFPPGRK